MGQEGRVRRGVHRSQSVAGYTCLTRSPSTVVSGVPGLGATVPTSSLYRQPSRLWDQDKGSSVSRVLSNLRRSGEGRAALPMVRVQRSQSLAPARHRGDSVIRSKVSGGASQSSGVRRVASLHSNRRGRHRLEGGEEECRGDKG